MNDVNEPARNGAIFAAVPQMVAGIKQKNLTTSLRGRSVQIHCCAAEHVSWLFTLKTSMHPYKHSPT